MKRFCAIVLLCVLLALPCGSGVSAAYTTNSPFKATFLQGWLCRDWTQARWTEEFEAMKAAGFEALILQSVCDLSHEQTDSALSTHDPDAYRLTSAYTMYPSALAGLEGAYVSSQNGGDALALTLEAARQTDMQVWLGLVSDDLWWQYGWGLPQYGNDGTAYFSAWSGQNGSLCAGVIGELWDRYGEAYGAQIAGWYYVNEIWNMDAACAGTDDGFYAAEIARNIRYSIDAIAQRCPEKPLMISPFFNETLSTATQYGDFWREIFAQAGFRPQDIFAHQNGGGGEREPAVIREWALALKAATEDAGGLQFWLNDETFQKDGASKPISELRENFEATADLAACRIVFSWNHYYNPLVKPEAAALNEEFLALAATLSAPCRGDLNADGSCSVTDLILLQKWLLAVPGVAPANPAAGDFTGDGLLDVWDLGWMKRALLQ